MNKITDSIRNEREYNGILKLVTEQARLKKPLPMLVTGLCDGARTAFYISLAEDIKKLYGRGFLLIVPDEKDALRIANAFSECGLTPLVYPLRDFVFHNITASHEFEHERLAVLSAVMSDAYDVVITTPDAAVQFTMPRNVLAGAVKHLKSGSQCDMDELILFLNRSGYFRTDMVDGTGQYSLRGGIVDIFPPQSEYPIRIDFFDNIIDQIGIFDILTQRKIENITGADITPAREIVVNDEVRSGLSKIISAQLKKTKDEQLSSELESLNSGVEINFADKYISFIYPENFCLLDYFDNAPITVIQEYNAVQDRLKSFDWHMKESVTSMLENGSINSKYAVYNKWTEDFNYITENHSGIIVDMFAASVSNRRLSGMFTFLTKQTVSYADSWDLLKEDIEHFVSINYRLVLLCENEMMAKSIREMLLDISHIPEIIYGENLQGYELTMTKFACLSLYTNPNSLYRTVNTKTKHGGRKKSSQEKIMSYADLEIGDYVVHESHGIGQYLGLQTLTVEGVTKEFVKVKYGGTDMLYLPCNQLDTLSKYIGARTEEGAVKLSKMGGTDWVKAKTKAKSAAKNMAKELIKLYAERMKHEGYQFEPDDEMQREFEAAFEYEETDGQLTAISEIKNDMERKVPMERLLCGDVGFGKTEVALRAAFKAVTNFKQVAILVPTTILAMQHYQTLLTRMRGFPIKVDMLSRFRTPKQQQETLRRLRRGDIDIIVGTHRIVSKDVQFKDLGLLIVDEEQRFGVAQKEKLKQVAVDVDVLTLTATPIPRTLNMAMSGIKDMSVLEEAPGDRLPVQTYVLEYDDIIIGEALKKELRRGGQVFYLYNRVETINQVAAKVAAMVPDARIAVAHGQMDKEVLSDIWRALVVGELDILISTTIIETGVDVPNANTLIIENADKMGLSQLHQIRGRVGRSSRRAYAYFTYSKGKVLSEIATKRLSAIRDYTEFGSGFKVALRDLEIRGAGNLLGSEQHGNIESIGYDLYMRLLNEAILEEKGESAKAKSECTVDLNYSAYIPENYIRTSSQRIDAYKKVASIENEEDLKDITDELLDRYGDIPEATYNLLKVSLIHGLGSECGMQRVSQRDGNIFIYPEQVDVNIWTLMAIEFKGRLLLNLSSKPYVSYKIRKGEEPMKFITELLKKYISKRGEIKK